MSAVDEDPEGHGADPSIQDARYPSTPLGWASYLGRDDVVALLTELTL